MSFVSGLDLGQVSDFSAWAIAEKLPCPHPTRAGMNAWTYAIRHLQRWPLGTPYTQIVDEVREVCRLRLRGAPLVVDGTGVGRAVVDLFRKAGCAGRLVSVTITGGHSATEDADKRGWSVPKKDLVGVMQALLQTKRLDVAKKLPDAETLRRELGNFKVKITAAANETFGAWREGQHDDLVLAVAMACWFGERGGTATINATAPPRRDQLPEVLKAPGGVFNSDNGMDDDDDD